MRVSVHRENPPDCFSERKAASTEDATHRQRQRQLELSAPLVNPVSQLLLSLLYAVPDAVGM